MGLAILIIVWITVGVIFSYKNFLKNDMLNTYSSAVEMAVLGILLGFMNLFIWIVQLDFWEKELKK